MVRKLVNRLFDWLQATTAPWWRERLPAPELLGPAPVGNYRRLERVVVAEEVNQTLFDEYAEHRRGDRGSEEIGWVLMGLRQEDEVLVLATLPAGTARSASSTHVRFDSDTQGLASRAVRQKDKRRLTIVGVVHTHPGSLRHPSEGDYQGDSRWVGKLRGGEGVFGIGTAEDDMVTRWQGDKVNQDSHVTLSPSHLVTLSSPSLRFSWYALAQGDDTYRRLPVELTPGPDLARPLHAVWPIMEIHAGRLDRLFRQLTNVTLEAVPGASRPLLALNVKLAEPGESLRVVMDRQTIQYYVSRQSEVSAVEPGESNIESALYKILAELASRAP